MSKIKANRKRPHKVDRRLDFRYTVRVEKESMEALRNLKREYNVTYAELLRYALYVAFGIGDAKYDDLSK